MRTKNHVVGAAPRSRDIEGRLLLFFGGLLFDATAHLASGAVGYLFGYRRRARRSSRGAAR